MMKKKFKIILIVVLVLFILIGLLYILDFIRFINDEIPLLFHIDVKYEGMIIEINDHKGAYPTGILVEENKKEDFKSKVLITLTDNIKLEYKGKSINVSDFNIGDIIEVSYNGNENQTSPGTLLGITKIKIIKKQK